MPAADRLAGSLALLAGLEHTGVPAMPWYQFRPPALLLGSAQRTHEVDLAACAAAHVSVHRRRSGGGVVLSDSLLLLDVALGALGITAHVVDIATSRADAQMLDPLLWRVCFGGLSPYEVVIGRRKVVGLAQVRRRTGALLQAGVYLHWAPARTAALVAATPAERATLTTQLAARTVGLYDLTRYQSPTIDVVAQEVGLALE